MIKMDSNWINLSQTSLIPFWVTTGYQLNPFYRRKNIFCAFYEIFINEFNIILYVQEFTIIILNMMKKNDLDRINKCLSYFAK